MLDPPMRGAKPLRLPGQTRAGAAPICEKKWENLFRLSHIGVSNANDLKATSRFKAYLNLRLRAASDFFLRLTDGFS